MVARGLGECLSIISLFLSLFMLRLLPFADEFKILCRGNTTITTTTTNNNNRNKNALAYELHNTYLSIETSAQARSPCSGFSGRATTVSGFLHRKVPLHLQKAVQVSAILMQEQSPELHAVLHQQLVRFSTASGAGSCSCSAYCG